MATPSQPASGKYGGFGSKDMEQFGYNDSNKFGSAYDPYVTKNQPPAPATQSKKETTKSEYKS